MSAVPKETSVSEYIPYSHHVTPTIISTRNADYLSVWKIAGRSHQSASAEDVYDWVRELNNLWRGVANENFTLCTHTIRRQVSEYPDSDFDNAFCHRLDDKYRESFTGYDLRVNDLYLTIVYRPVSDKILSAFAKYEKLDQHEKVHRQATAIKALDEANRMIGASMKRYGAELFAIYDKNGIAFSAPAEFLAMLINGEHKRIPVCKERLGDYMAFNRPFFSAWGEIGEIRGIDRTRTFGMLELFEHTDKPEPGHLNGLLEARCDFVLTQSFAALSRHAAIDALKRQEKLLKDSNDVAVEQIEQLRDAMSQLMAGEFVMGEHHATLTIFVEGSGREAAAQVRDHLAAASATLLDAGIKPAMCDMALEAAWWAQLPANWKYRPRPMPITSLNFVCFAGFHNFMSGKPAGNPWGPAVTILKTVSGTPVYFNFHASRLDDDVHGERLAGNTAIFGKTGTGKTVLLGFLLAQAQKFNPTIVAFDKDRGMEMAVRAMGGCYQPLQIGVPSGWNPLQLEPTPGTMAFLREFVKKLATVPGSLVTHSDEQEIDAALETVMFHMDKSSRRLSMLLQNLPNPRAHERDARATVHARLEKWCDQSKLGWLFDNADDDMDLGAHRMYGFDMTELLDDPVTRVPAVMYLIHRTEGMIDGRRFIYVADEFWKLLQDEAFVELAKNKQKTIRKQNGLWIFCTQEPSDVLDSDIAKTLVQQCATLVCLPNPSADRSDYVDGLKLTEAEFDVVRNLGENSRRFLIKQGDSSAVAELNLDGFEDELLVLSGTPDNARLLETVMKEVGDEPESWMPVFLERAKEKRRSA